MKLQIVDVIDEIRLYITGAIITLVQSQHNKSVKS